MLDIFLTVVCAICLELLGFVLACFKAGSCNSIIFLGCHHFEEKNNTLEILRQKSFFFYKNKNFNQYVKNNNKWGFKASIQFLSLNFRKIIN